MDDEEETENWDLDVDDDNDDGNVDGEEEEEEEDKDKDDVEMNSKQKEEDQEEETKNDATGTTPSIISRLALNPLKAGLEGVDREQVNRVIYQVSQGSRFFRSELRRDGKQSQRIAHLLRRFERLRPADVLEAQADVDRLLAEWETSQRVLDKVLVHVDMDSFYASVEMRDHPELRSVPMAVGDMSMLCTANYEARRYGVRSAMPGYIAKRLCPSLLLIPLHFPKYFAAAEQVRTVLKEYDPNFEAAGLDESFLDITQHLQSREDGALPSDVVKEMREKIFQATQLTASAGIAPNKMLCKICSDINKPNGQFLIPFDRQSVLDFIRVQPIRRVKGIGKVTERMLHALGISSVQDIYDKRAYLKLLMTPSSFQFFMRAALGLGSTDVGDAWERKSVGHEMTFAGVSSPGEIAAISQRVAQMVAKDLQEEKLEGKTLTVKLKTVDFDVLSRAITHHKYIQSQETIEQLAWSLIERELPLSLRLLGIRMTSLRSTETKPPSASSIDAYFSPTKPKATTETEAEQKEIDSEKKPEPDGVSGECPICGVVLNLGDSANVQLNDHIDACLQARDKAGLTKKSPSGSPWKRRRLSNSSPDSESSASSSSSLLMAKFLNRISDSTRSPLE